MECSPYPIIHQSNQRILFLNFSNLLWHRASMTPRSGVSQFSACLPDALFHQLTKKNRNHFGLADNRECGSGCVQQKRLRTIVKDELFDRRPPPERSTEHGQFLDHLVIGFFQDTDPVNGDHHPCSHDAHFTVHKNRLHT